MTKISIITPCFNAQKYIAQTYDSIKSQSYENWEWVIVDDHSTDESLEILQNISKTDQRVRVFTNIQNSGAAVTRNNCLNNSTGDYVAFLDVDDFWAANKLEDQLEFMQKNNIEFSYHNYDTVNAEGRRIKGHRPAAKVSQNDILKFNPFATSSVMIKRDLIEKNNIRFKEHLRRRQDYIFWYEALGLTQAAFCLNQFLSSYRIFGNESLSSNKKNMAIIQWQLYRSEFGLNIVQSVYYFVFYAVHGVRKYFF